MRGTIAESDWKLLRRLKETALERFCQRVIDRLGGISADQGKSFHARYLEIFRIIQDEDRQLALAFDDMRRSTAVMRLIAMRAENLITDDEFQQFSEETRRMVDGFLALR